MIHQLSGAGAANTELVIEVHKWWREAAERTGINLSGFNPGDSLEVRISWALSQGLTIGTVYSRFSSRRQHSTSDQVRTCVQHAAAKQIYCPPEFVCVDEAQRGYRMRRQGLDRMLSILKQRRATVLLVFKASRLYRQAFKGYQLIQQEVVEEGLRAISVTQGIDTSDTKAWRMLIQVHGMVDDMVIEATADHVRAGLKGLFARGYTVGALQVGYRRKVIPNAPMTNRGLPRTVPEVDPDVARMIVEHFTLIRDGMPIRQGWRKWMADGGPADRRSTKGYMSSIAYRRMLSRVAYIGRWEFGRKRNEFSTKRDYARQIMQHEDAVEFLQCEELRIVEDELFFAVQSRLAQLTKGPRGPKKDKKPLLCDLVIDMFWCAQCNVRFHQAGANGRGMRCKNGDLCPCQSTVRRDAATQAICEQLCALINQDSELIEDIICRVQERSFLGDDELKTEVAGLERRIATLSNKLSDFYQMAGQGNDDDRKEIMRQVASALAERSSANHELSQRKRQLARSTATIQPEAVRESLAGVSALLMDAASGVLGEEAVYKAEAVIRALVGGRVMVHVECRKGRKRTNVRGVFTPQLIRAVADQAEVPHCHESSGNEVSVWLRKPPRLDAIAERVHELIDVEKLSHRDTAEHLQKEGHEVNSGNVWYSYQRWYEMNGRTPPSLPYNNGNRRKSS